MLDLDWETLNSVVETAMRLETLQKIDEACTARLVQHADAKQFKKEIKALSKSIGAAPVKTGDDLVKDLQKAQRRR